jgi:selenocysteine lyase/cysteine desulfurase
MPTGLFLDSARLGLMPTRASRALHDLVRLVGREGASSAVVDLLRGGFDGWPRTLRGRYPDLGDWRGLSPFLQAVRALTGAPAAAEILLSSHSAPLMELAAYLLCRACRVILHTDLDWPPYLEILRAEAARRGRRLVCVPVGEFLFEDLASGGDLIERLAAGYRRSGADGLYLTEITHHGVRLPATRVVRSLAGGGLPRFVVVDAAQVPGHAPLDLDSGPADLCLAGCHKWVGSGLPLSVAVAPKSRSRGFVRETADSLLDARRLEDPLFRFAGLLSGGDLERPGGTVNLAPLFTACAAVSVQLGRTESAAARFNRRLDSRRVLSVLAHEAGWEPVTVHPDLQSGILLMRARGEAARVPADRLRSCFRRHGVALTAFPGGIVRASLPETAWTEARQDVLLIAFRRVRLELGRGDLRGSSGAPGWNGPAGRRETLRADVSLPG